MKCPYCHKEMIDDSSGGSICQFCSARYTPEKKEVLVQQLQRDKKLFKIKLVWILAISAVYITSFVVQLLLLMREPDSFGFGFFGLIGFIFGAYGLYFSFISESRIGEMQERMEVSGCLWSIVKAVILICFGWIYISIGTPSLRQIRMKGVFSLIAGLIFVFLPLVVATLL